MSVVRATARDDTMPHQIRITRRISGGFKVGCACGAPQIPIPEVSPDRDHWAAYNQLDHNLRRGRFALVDADTGTALRWVSSG